MIYRTWPIAKRASDVTTKTRQTSVPKTLVKQKLRLHSLYFLQNTLMLTESRGEFGDLHSNFRLRALCYWNLEMLIFEEGGKTENLEKNPRSKGENQQQTQSTYDAGSGNRTRDTLVEGERSHHCATPATQQEKDKYMAA